MATNKQSGSNSTVQKALIVVVGSALIAQAATRRVLSNWAFYRQHPQVRTQQAAELRDWEKRKGYHS